VSRLIEKLDQALFPEKFRRYVTFRVATIFVAVVAIGSSIVDLMNGRTEVPHDAIVQTGVYLMHSVNNSVAAIDLVNHTPSNAISPEQLKAVIRFLPILEKISPDDLAHLVRLPDHEDVCYGVGHIAFHPAVRNFIKACYENEFVQSFDWPAGLLRRVATWVTLHLSAPLGFTGAVR
jgi:hypothetical protein